MVSHNMIRAITLFQFMKGIIDSCASSRNRITGAETKYGFHQNIIASSLLCLKGIIRDCYLVLIVVYTQINKYLLFLYTYGIHKMTVVFFFVSL